MPLRRALPSAVISPFRATVAATQIRFVHATTALRHDVHDQTHYEALNVAPDATPADIKKSFYALSKTHHPDHNPSDPTSPARFVRISEAYSVLGTPAKRAAYDRDVLRLHEHPPSGRHHRHGGSYHSTTGPAGGRPAAGLSRRRGSFRGPPPSFYRSGGWGAQTDKRRDAHETSTGGGGGAGAAGAAEQPGMGPGQDPFGHQDEVPHFDSRSHTRTHQRQDARRAWRARGRQDHGGSDGEAGLFGGFVVVAGTLAVGMLVPALILSGSFASPKKGRGRS